MPHPRPLERGGCRCSRHDPSRVSPQRARHRKLRRDGGRSPELVPLVQHHPPPVHAEYGTVPAELVRQAVDGDDDQVPSVRQFTRGEAVKRRQRIVPLRSTHRPGARPPDAGPRHLRVNPEIRHVRLALDAEEPPGRVACPVGRPVRALPLGLPLGAPDNADRGPILRRARREGDLLEPVGDEHRR